MNSNTGYISNMNLPLSLISIVSAIKLAGGRAMLIGGGVIDSLKGLPIKDWDVEVYNISIGKLEELLAGFGQPNLVGKAFGIIKLSVDDIDYDFSVPRRENRVGVGHTAFTVELDDALTPREAGLRRDLTINSMYMDLHTMELVDPFNGLKDLFFGCIRATCPSTFVEDPLRVLRIMQLLPRKGEYVSNSTMELCRSMVDECQHLPAERVFEEFKKLLLKADKPSIGLEFLRECGWLTHFPELYSLINCKQNPEHHPEGDAWVHTLWCVDNAAQLKHLVPVEWQLPFMLGALCHDLGKPLSTDPDTLTAYGHDALGEEPTRMFLSRITRETELIERVVMLVTQHMMPGQLHRGEAGIASWKRLHNKCRLDVLGQLSKADSCARPNRSFDEHPVSEACFKHFNTFGETVIKPIVLGRHLIQKGIAPGPQFGKILKLAYDYQIETGEEDVCVILSNVL